VRERGVQARRARSADDDPSPAPPPASGIRFWQALAVVALIAATAGWTTVAVIAMRPAPAAVAAASPTDEPPPSDEASVEPPVEFHQVADLENLLPAALNGISLTRQSWTGDMILGDGSSWGTSLTTFLATAGKTPADLQASQAVDDSGSLDLSAGAFRASGIEGAALRDAIIAAFKGDFPDLKVTHIKIGGFDVTKGDFGDGGIPTYWYVRDGLVFDIESSDASIVAAALAALPNPGAGRPTSGAPASPSPANSPVPSPS
jgi:hypothetical protein